MTEDPAPTERQQGSRHPLAIFAGFLLLGAALAMILFGGDLLGGRNETEPEPAVLDQVSPFPTAGAEVARVPNTGGDSGALEVGDPAPDFTLNDLDGQPVTLSAFRGRPVIINFWATWCAPCRIEMPALQAAYEKHQDRGLVILALDQDEPAEVARSFFYDEMGLTFTPLLDENGLVAADYGNYGILPTTYFVNAEGIVTAVHRGPLTERQLEERLALTFD
ncbi:MAG: TlpA disulfide reductase family protein [Candidatus Promineifilaceae bacterium]|nr:TlpA disulfide reductase family protein [Candidatus Promineifilaceae bacterium]